MKNPELYKKTVDILVNAYFNDTLVAGQCTACACGNIIAANAGYKIEKLNGDVAWFTCSGSVVNAKWQKAVYTKTFKGLFGYRSYTQVSKIEKYVGETRRQINLSGYSLQDFADIEYAFETGYKGEDKIFNALMSVIDALDIIHENNDKAVSEIYKKKFHKCNT